MGKFLLTCSIVILFILLQTEEIGSSSILKKSLFNKPSKFNFKPMKTSKYQPSYVPSKPVGAGTAPLPLPPPRDIFVPYIVPNLLGNQNNPLLYNPQKPFSSYSERGSARPHGGNRGDPKPKGDKVGRVVWEHVLPEVHENFILGSPIAKMYFRFNDREEERWWNENRHRFATHVYHPNISQPISRNVFMSECVNVTVGEYVKPTGNHTEDELEARVVTQVANEKCVEMYPRLTFLTMRGFFNNNKPGIATILENKSEFKYGEGAVLANSPSGASGHNSQKNAVSDLHFSFESVLFLIHPFAISVLTLITPFLIF